MSICSLMIYVYVNALSMHMRQVECHQVCLRPPAANPGHSPGTWPAGPSIPVVPRSRPPLGIKNIQHLSAKSIKKIKNIAIRAGRPRTNFFNCFNWFSWEVLNFLNSREGVQAMDWLGWRVRLSTCLGNGLDWLLEASSTPDDIPPDAFHNQTYLLPNTILMHAQGIDIHIYHQWTYTHLSQRVNIILKHQHNIFA